MISIEVPDLAKLQAAFNRAPEAVTRETDIALTRSAIILQRRARTEAPHRTGNLRRMIQYSRMRGAARIVSQAEYSLAVHEGTKPRTIYPVNKKALYWPGAAHPVKSVNHPGTKANKFMERAVEGEERSIQQEFSNALERVMRGLSG